MRTTEYWGSIVDSRSNFVRDVEVDEIRDLLLVQECEQYEESTAAAFTFGGVNLQGASLSNVNININIDKK